MADAEGGQGSPQGVSRGPPQGTQGAPQGITLGSSQGPKQGPTQGPPQGLVLGTPQRLSQGPPPILTQSPPHRLSQGPPRPPSQNTYNNQPISNLTTLSSQGPNYNRTQSPKFFSNQVPTFDNNQARSGRRQSRQMRFDREYVKTIPGILKLVQIVCNTIGFICIKVSWAWVSAIFYSLLYWVATLITTSLFLAYTFHAVEKYDQWPWHKAEFIYCSGVTITYFICSIFAWTIGESVGYAVGFFGLCAMIAYAFDGYLKYKGWKSGLPPQ